jgi:hypothetical protein
MSTHEAPIHNIISTLAVQNTVPITLPILFIICIISLSVIIVYHPAALLSILFFKKNEGFYSLTFGLNFTRIANSAYPYDDTPLDVEHDFASSGINYMSTFHIVAQTALDAKGDCVFQTIDLVNVFHSTVINHNLIDVLHSITFLS